MKLTERIRHTTYSWNIKWQKCALIGLNGFVFKKINKIKLLKLKNYPGSLLNSTANPAQFGWKLEKHTLYQIVGLLLILTSDLRRTLAPLFCTVSKISTNTKFMHEC